MPPALTTFAFLAGCILLIPAVLYGLGLLKDTFHPLFFVGTVSFSLTVYGVFVNREQSLQFVPAEALIVYLLLVILCFAGFAAGWFYARRRDRGIRMAPLQPPVYRSNLLFLFAIIFTLVGVPIALYTRNDFSVTGYLRDFGQLWMVGALLAIQSGLLQPSLRPAAIILVILCLLPPIDRFLTYGQRGDTFRVALLIVPIFLFYQRRPQRVFFIPAALGLALVLATLVQTRALVYTGEAKNRFDALSKVIPSFVDGKNRQPIQGSEEYIFGSAMVAAARHTNDYDHGFGFLYNLGVRFLPKEYFDKDSLYTAWSPGNYIVHVASDAGYGIPGGSAPSGFAHTFVEFWWFAPLFWALLGFWARRIYLGALTGDLARQGYFVAFFIIMLYLLSQDLYTSSMNAIYTLPSLFLAYKAARVTQDESAEEGYVFDVASQFDVPTQPV
jgi:hypothetical protein